MIFRYITIHIYIYIQYILQYIQYMYIYILYIYLRHKECQVSQLSPTNCLNPSLPLPNLVHHSMPGFGVEDHVLHAHTDNPKGLRGVVGRRSRRMAFFFGNALHVSVIFHQTKAAVVCDITQCNTCDV